MGEREMRVRLEYSPFMLIRMQVRVGEFEQILRRRVDNGLCRSMPEPAMSQVSARRRARSRQSGSVSDLQVIDQSRGRASAAHSRYEADRS